MDVGVVQKRWEDSRATFRKVAGAIPSGKEGFRPAPEAMALGEHVLHVASAEKTFLDAMTTTPGKWEWKTGLDLERYPALGDILGALDRQTEAMRRYLKGLTVADLAAKVRTPWAEETLEDLLYGWVLHEVHHRGSLIASLRVAGVTPPSIW